MESVILKNPTDQEIWKVARKKGMLTMKEDAILKAFDLSSAPSLTIDLYFSGSASADTV